MLARSGAMRCARSNVRWHSRATQQRGGAAANPVAGASSLLASQSELAASAARTHARRRPKAPATSATAQRTRAHARFPGRGDARHHRPQRNATAELDATRTAELDATLMKRHARPRGVRRLQRRHPMPYTANEAEASAIRFLRATTTLATAHAATKPRGVRCLSAGFARGVPRRFASRIRTRRRCHLHLIAWQAPPSWCVRPRLPRRVRPPLRRCPPRHFVSRRIMLCDLFGAARLFDP